jgi:hypothetical protein
LVVKLMRIVIVASILLFMLEGGLRLFYNRLDQGLQTEILQGAPSEFMPKLPRVLQPPQGYVHETCEIDPCSFLCV